MKTLLPVSLFIIQTAILLSGCNEEKNGIIDGDEDVDRVEAADTVVDMECTNDADCSNGLVCDGMETCVEDACRPGEPLDCEDEDPCTMDSCSEDEGGCVHDPLDADGDGYVAKEAPDGTFCGGTDCNDNDNNINFEALEKCDEIDNDCDGNIDEEIYDLQDNLPVSVLSGLNKWPSLVFTGSEYGVAWFSHFDSDWEIYFARISEDGSCVVGGDRITNVPGESSQPSLVFSGGNYGIAWQDGRSLNTEIYFSRISAVGIEIGEDTRITEASHNSLLPSLVSTGSEYGVAWTDTRDGNGEIYFARISMDGEKLEEDVRITNAPTTSGAPSLVFTGSEYGVAWHDGRDGNYEIYFALISMDGAMNGSDIRTTNASGQSLYPSLVFTGSEYAIAWYDNHDMNNEIYFTRISMDGEKSGEDVRITDSTGESINPSLEFTGSEFGITWQSDSEGNDDIYFTRISADGERLQEDIRLTETLHESSHPAIVFTGSEYGVAWQEDLYDILFTRIGCL